VEFEPQPYTRYYWKVIVTTDAEEVIESDTQFFETAKMDEPWTGRWITCDSSQERHPIFSKRIRPAKEVKSARLYICGLGLYEAYFLGENKENPEKIGDEYLTPYCNNYDQWIQYQTYDITKQAEQGGVLSVLLGNGWYKGRFGFNDPEREAYYGDEWKLIAEIHIEYKDGTKDVISSDETWSVTRSNLWFSNIYDGERRDDTLPPVEESPARIAKVPKGRLMERLSLPVKVQEEMKPAELIHTPAGEDVFDLGQEIAGIFRLRVHEPAGTTIRIQTGEVLQDGCFYNENLRTALSEYIYVSDGTEKVITPHFTYYGYRYVKVTGVRDLSCEDFTARVLYSDYESIGAIETGNDLVNKLISNIEWGMKGNFLDVPTDCPQRDERMGWTGDTQVFSATASYLADTYAFYRKYLYDLYQEQLLAGGMVPEIVPTFGPTKCSCAWGDAAAAAKRAAEAAKTAAVDARDKAQTAKTAAENARESAENSEANAKTYKESAAESAATAQQYSGKPPKPENGTWWIWDAEKGTYVNTNISCELTGPTGNGIQSIQLTQGNHTPGSTDIYTVTMTDGSKYNIAVYNGLNGTGTGDVLGIHFDLVLPASGWSNGSITVAESRLVAAAKYKYLIDAYEASREEYLECNVRPKDISTTGFITFVNDTDPIKDITVNIVRLELSVNAEEGGE